MSHPECITPSGAPLYRWPSGLRYVPPPTTCQGCSKPAQGLLSWNDKRGLLHDFAGCRACASAKRNELDAAGMAVRAFRLENL